MGSVRSVPHRPPEEGSARPREAAAVPGPGGGVSGRRASEPQPGEEERGAGRRRGRAGSGAGRCGSRISAGRPAPPPRMWWDERVSARFRRNLQPTLTYWSVFFSFGLCIAFLGPTLLDLRCQTQSSLSQITWVFFSQQFCLLLGSCLGGVFKRT